MAMFPDPTPAQKLAMTSTHPRAVDRDWLMSVVGRLDRWAEEEPLGPDVFFSYAGDHELEAAEESVDESFPEDDEEEEEEA